MFNFGYDTYQDVRRNLFYYSVPTLVLAGFFFFFFVLPPTQQSAVTVLIEKFTSSPLWKWTLGGASGLAIFTGLAFVMTEVLQIHDQWYDKYIIGWRFRYATDFILPRLIQPFASLTNYRFYEEAERNIRQFQERLYYPFVGDRDLKIPKNKLIRFYEVVTVYWLTQVNEIVLLVLTIGVFIYRFSGPANLSYRTLLCNDLLLLAVLWMLNRLWVISSRGKVRHGTEDEIKAILDNPELKRDLEVKLHKLCADYNIPYGQTTN